MHGRGDRPTRDHWSLRAPFGITIFLSAFLLFQAQLILGKEILPLFGGAPAVWTACLLVFQMLLLAGYAFAHALASRLRARSQAGLQLTIMGLSVALLAVMASQWPTPITPGPAWNGSGESDPTWVIVKFLLATVGLPFLLLSTTSPLGQHWFRGANPDKSPYRLYALSNVGSMLGLLSYPLVVEPFLRLRVQAWVWVGGYIVYVVAFGVCAVRVRWAVSRAPAVENCNADIQPAGASPGAAQMAWWIALAGCASLLLLATTNFLCQEVAVIPFLWVLPLCLYLASFILCFESERWYRPAVFQVIFAMAAGAVILVTLPNTNYPYFVQLAACLLLLFAGCMVCHGSAARTRPHPAHLTTFYLCISIGGALGGVFVSLVAPRVFASYWEYPLGVLLCAGLMLSSAMRDPTSWWHESRPLSAAVVLGLAVLLAPSIAAPVWSAAAHTSIWTRLGLAIAVPAIVFLKPLRGYRRGKAARPVWPMRVAVRVCLALLTAGLAIPQKAEFFHVIARDRNFYGVLSVVAGQDDNYLALRHGKTVHGFQFQDAPRRHLATGYYGENSPPNIVIRNWAQRPMRVGLVGMGTGTLAAIGRAGDVYRFYEINPDVYRWSSGAEPYFTFLKDSAARTEVALGDARITLEREASSGELQKFDVLVLDAFSSDAIPMHLLTREAFALYERHLRGPQSVIAVHISNRMLDLSPVLAGVAKEFGLHGSRGVTLSLQSYLWTSDWVLLSRDAAALDLPELKVSRIPFPGEAPPVLWTDDYSNLVRLLR